MKLKTILAEDVLLFEGVRVSPSILSRVLKKSTGLNMGFEIEFTMEGGSKGDIQIQELSFRNLEDYFEDPKLDNEKLTEYLYENSEDFIDRMDLIDEWMDNHLRRNNDWYKDWIEENGHEDDPEEDWPDEDEVKDSIQEEHEDEINEFIDEHLYDIELTEIAEKWIENDPVGFIQEMEWYFLPGYDMDGYGTITSTGVDMDHIQQQLEEIVDESVEVLYDYHGSEKEWDTWYIEPDSSVDNGAEISSPVKPVDESIQDLEKIFDWMVDSDFETNSQTGLHVSLSFEEGELPENMDWVKLAVLMGEDYLLKEFDRAANSYTKSQLNKIKQFIEERNVKGIREWKGFNEIRENLKLAISGNRESSFNISEFEKTGRIEFRIMGNEDYHRRFDDVKNGIGRYVMFLEVARSPNLYKTEYLKKLGKLISGAAEEGDSLKANEENMKNVDSDLKKWVRALGSAFGALPKRAITTLRELMISIEMAKSHPEGMSNSEVRSNFFSLFQYYLADAAEKTINSAITESYSFIEYLIEASQKGRLERMKKVTRMLAKLANITPDDYQKRFGRPPEYFLNQITSKDKVGNSESIAILLFKDSDDMFNAKRKENNEYDKAGMEIEDGMTKRIYQKILGDIHDTFGSRDVYPAFMKFVTRLQNEKAKTNPTIKKFVKYILTELEKRGENLDDYMVQIAEKENGQAAVEYCYAILGRQKPQPQQPPQQQQQQQQQNQNSQQNAEAIRQQQLQQQQQINQERQARLHAAWSDTD